MLNTCKRSNCRAAILAPPIRLPSVTCWRDESMMLCLHSIALVSIRPVLTFITMNRQDTSPSQAPVTALYASATKSAGQ
eukprot:353299-Chlamydomonas_euryale.AAC.20